MVMALIDRSQWISGEHRFGPLSKVNFSAKVYTYGSKHGIGHGRISKLTVRKAGSQRVLYHYDRGLDISSETFTAKHLTELTEHIFTLVEEPQQWKTMTSRTNLEK